MRKARRGVTLTELLTVVSVLTIMTSFVTPVIMSVKHAAVARVCSNNMRQIYLALQLYANNQYGKLPACFELNYNAAPSGSNPSSYPIWENSWWYRKVSGFLYPRSDPLAGGYVPAEQFVMRCPSTLDAYNDYYAPPGYPRVDAGSNSDKDRVFDDNYGYNNFGFVYYNHVAAAAVVNPDTIRWGTLAPSNYYHGSCAINAVPSGTVTIGGWGTIVGRLTHQKNPAIVPPASPVCLCGNAWPCVYTAMGQYSKVAEGSRTIVLMDYIKADVAPELTNDGVWGYRFRHGGRANVLFADGHVNLYAKSSFLPDIGAVDPSTQRTRIHWSVLRP